jgi:hypothetical protein
LQVVSELQVVAGSCRKLGEVIGSSWNCGVIGNAEFMGVSMTGESCFQIIWKRTKEKSIAFTAKSIGVK